MEQIERIAEMEEYLDDAENVLKEFAKALGKYEQCLKRMDALSEYYGSKDWFQDVEDYDSGRLPKGLKCGVLSEDSIYSMLTDNKELAIRMLEVGTRIIKNS